MKKHWKSGFYGAALFAASAMLLWGCATKEETAVTAGNGKNVFKPYPVSPRKIEIGSKPIITLCTNGEAAFEVVKPANPAAGSAAGELIARLAQITGKTVFMTAQATGKVPAFYLGVCPESEALGLDPEKLDRDGFFIRTDGNHIFITGCDSNDPKKVQRGTLFGVYDFLERFAGVRYYFPGEIGTIVPKKKDWTLPEIDIIERPDTQYRWIWCCPGYMQSGVQYEYKYPGQTTIAPMTWRNSTLNSIRSCHGLNDLELVRRFAKTHPEFFAMTATGDRHDGARITTTFHKFGHLCYSSEGLKEEIYQDVVACLTGKPASTRGLPKWRTRWTTDHVDLAPNDGMEWCQCPKCKAIQAQGKQAMSDHIWRFVCDIALRLKKEGIRGYVMLDAYGVFNLVPSFPIPDNVMVGVAVSGPWGLSREDSRISQAKRILDWSRAVQAKVKLWTYPTKAGFRVPLVPNFTPRAVGAFFQSQKDHIFGSFVESGSDRWMYGFLNSYVAAKVMWNWETDVEQLIDEHCRLMYGKAAPQMNEFYAILEDTWLNGVVGETVETPVGPVAKVPTRRDVWTKILSPQKVSAVSALLDSAENAVADDPESLKRVKFMRNELWQPVILGQQAFQAETANRTAWTLYAAEAGNITMDGQLNEPEWGTAVPVWLRSNRPGLPTEVKTRVKMLRDAENFYFGFEADEPETEKMVALTGRAPDSNEVWRDNGAEIFLSADAGSDFIYQFIFNSAGFKSDLKNSNFAVDQAYNSGFEVKTSVIPGKKWFAEVRIPRKDMPELEGKTFFVGNFTRHRVLDGVTVGTEFYAWFPKTRNIAENCGTIRLGHPEKEKEADLIKDGDFDRSIHDDRFMGLSWAGVGEGKVHLTADHEYFITNGSSLRLEPGSSAARQNIPVQPGRQYKLSFFVRTEKLDPGLRVIVRYGGDPAPPLYILGDYRDYIRDTVDWYRVEKIFRAPERFGREYAPHIEFFIGKSTGKCWIDHVELHEIAEPEKHLDGAYLDAVKSDERGGMRDER